MRKTLFVQAALTAVFGLLRPGSTSWLVLTLAMAFAAVGVGASLGSTRSRTAVLAFEGMAVAFGAVSLLGGHYVPGTVIGLTLLVRVAKAPADAFGQAPAAVPAPTPTPYADPLALIPAQPFAPTGFAGAWAAPAERPAAPAERPAAPAAEAAPVAPVVPAVQPPPLPVQPAAPALPLTAPACLTILPN